MTRALLSFIPEQGKNNIRGRIRVLRGLFEPSSYGNQSICYIERATCQRARLGATEAKFHRSAHEKTSLENHFFVFTNAFTFDIQTLRDALTHHVSTARLNKTCHSGISFRDNNHGKGSYRQESAARPWMELAQRFDYGAPFAPFKTWVRGIGNGW